MSKADDLKIAQADLVTISGHINTARQGRTMLHRPQDEVESAVMLLERTARRLKRSFHQEEKD